MNWKQRKVIVTKKQSINREPIVVNLMRMDQKQHCQMKSEDKDQLKEQAIQTQDIVANTSNFGRQNSPALKMHQSNRYMGLPS